VKDLEERLRAELRNPRHALAAWPDPSSRIGAAITHRRRRRAVLTGTLVAAAAAALALVPLALMPLARGPLARGPGHAVTAPGPGGTGSGEPAPVPWLNLPVPSASPSPAVSTATAAPCATADLSRATVDSTGGAGGHTGYRMTVRNTGARRCTLVGPATVGGTDTTSGRRLTVTSGAPTFFDNPGDQRPPTLDAGQSASVTLVGDNGCDGGLNAHTYHFSTIGVAGRQDRLSGVTLTSSCPLQLGPWGRPVATPETEPSSPAYVDLRAQLDAPATATRGQPLRYVVVLTNPTTAAIALDPCPAYTEQLWKVLASFSLNCAGIEIPADGSVRFAMQLTLPAEPALVPSGPATLSWNLGGPGGSSVAATAAVTVTG
jgi:hypothetical protein